MKKVLAVLSLRGHRDRLRVFLDEGETLILTRLTVLERRLHEGRELDERELREIITLDADRMAFDTALTFLSYRPRSEAEVRRRLRRDRYAPRVLDNVIARLKQNGLLDDAAFAAWWTEDRGQHAPRGKALLKYELRQKGIEAETVQEAVADVDEEEGAYRLAQKRAPQLRKLEYPAFRQRLGSFLQRHGYPYSIAARTVRQVWSELHGNAADAEDDRLMVGLDGPEGEEAGGGDAPGADGAFPASSF